MICGIRCVFQAFRIDNRSLLVCHTYFDFSWLMFSCLRLSYDPFCAFVILSFILFDFLILVEHLLEDKQGIGLGEFVNYILFIFYPRCLIELC
jgi:hypothetical protein